MQRVLILGTPVDLVNLEQTLAWIEEKLAQPLPHCAQVITTNPEAVVRAQSDPALRQALLEGGGAGPVRPRPQAGPAGE